MTEVTLRIRFTQPCLGGKQVREAALVVLAMPRGFAGQVMFPPVWWKMIVTHGAKVKGGSASLAGKVQWSADVDGVPQRWVRHVPRTTDNRAGHVHHEAFLPGDIVAVDCVLPDGLTLDTFRVWMDAGGKYLGISPYKKGEWGRFVVVDVESHAKVVTQEQPDGMIASP